MVKTTQTPQQACHDPLDPRGLERAARISETPILRFSDAHLFVATLIVVSFVSGSAFAQDPEPEPQPEEEEELSLTTEDDDNVNEASDAWPNEPPRQEYETTVPTTSPSIVTEDDDYEEPDISPATHPGPDTSPTTEDDDEDEDSAYESQGYVD